MASRLKVKPGKAFYTQIVDGSETNYISVTLTLYAVTIKVFWKLLAQDNPETQCWRGF